MKWDYLAFMNEYSNSAIKELIEHQIDDESIEKLFGNSDKAVDLFTAFYEKLGYHNEAYDILNHAIERFCKGENHEI